MKLIENASQAYKFASVQFAALLSVVALADITMLEGKIPAHVYAGFGVVIAFARVIQQAIGKAKEQQ